MKDFEVFNFSFTYSATHKTLLKFTNQLPASYKFWEIFEWYLELKINLYNWLNYKPPFHFIPLGV